MCVQSSNFWCGSFPREWRERQTSERARSSYEWWPCACPRACVRFAAASAGRPSCRSLSCCDASCSVSLLSFRRHSVGVSQRTWNWKPWTPGIQENSAWPLSSAWRGGWCGFAWKVRHQSFWRIEGPFRNGAVQTTPALLRSAPFVSLLFKQIFNYSVFLNKWN